jgi:hypothetical protein
VGAKYDWSSCNLQSAIRNPQSAIKAVVDFNSFSGHYRQLVPRRQFLYGAFDRAVGHFRRYERRELASKLEKTGFAVLEVNYSI